MFRKLYAHSLIKIRLESQNFLIYKSRNNWSEEHILSRVIFDPQTTCTHFLRKHRFSCNYLLLAQSLVCILHATYLYVYNYYLGKKTLLVLVLLFNVVLPTRYSQCIGIVLASSSNLQLQVVRQVIGSKLPQGKVKCFLLAIHMSQYTAHAVFMELLNVKNAFCVPEVVELESRKQLQPVLL